MELIAVDPEKCNRDGVCVAVCPKMIIELKDGSPVPTLVEDAEKECSNCGHCLAACPQGALSLHTMAVADCPPVRPELLPRAEQVAHMLRARRSIRNFAKRPVPREKLGALIDIARFAPTGSNRQQVHWLVIHDTAEVRRLAGFTEEWLRHTVEMQRGTGVPTYERNLALAAARGADLVCRGAPHIVIAHAPKGRETDGVIALSYLELAAFSQGIGTCWAGFVASATREWPAMREAVGLPESHSICGAMLLGYPLYRYRRLPLRNQARIEWR